jgi:nucleoside-diphosphate-sugar epimerase
MKVFVAGATGVLGREAVRALVAAGHDVSGVSRSADKAALLSEIGAAPVAVDLFDPDAVAGAVEGADVVCNLATHIPKPSRYFLRSSWETNDRLHRDVSRSLVDGAIAAGASGYVQHSVGFMYADGADRWLDEGADLDPPPHGAAVLAAEAEARRFTAAGGAAVALRFGLFYGPPAAGVFVRTARAGFLPFPGKGDAFVPLIHTDDLGPAVVAALGAPAGSYNVVDDVPITRAELASVLASALGRRRVRLQPRMVRRATGERFDYLARSQRVTNRAFKTSTGWAPTVPDSRQAWAGTVGALSS